ncbi:gluconokinase [Ruficoccus amylovorans]|uniref:gluconokinase n=2 Tax=Ruficoccus amylovorans TaxID=1804625 RepID=A0A842HG44_9BACT|nr:gluconokinase [Ruficoccus amylovorans]
MCVVLMGVSGAGKTLIGQKLATAIGGEFFDGDDSHPAANVAKMRAGLPLDDADRLPWLRRLRALIEEREDRRNGARSGSGFQTEASKTGSAEAGASEGCAPAITPPPVILACSALKASYREILAPAGDPRVRFVYLTGSFEQIAQRLRERRGHFMPESLLRSQFEALEPPAEALSVDIGQSPEAIVAQIRHALKI